MHYCRNRYVASIIVFGLFLISVRMVSERPVPLGRLPININAGVELVPARLAAMGKTLPVVLKAREHPIALSAASFQPGLVTDEQLVTALSSALPRWHPPSVPSLMHELHLWGVDGSFDKKLVGEPWSGRSVAETLLNDRLCRERTVPLGASYLVDSPFGIHIVKLGSVDAREARGEAHTGQLLRILAEAQVPLSTAVTTETGRVGTVQGILQDAILRFSLERENEFMAAALALWLPPEKTWTDQYGTTHSFDELMVKLLDRPIGDGACGGCHVPYAVVLILRVDEGFHLLTPKSRARALRWLQRITRGLLNTQRMTGGWDSNWTGAAESRGAYYDDEVMNRIAVTGHHLEWIAFAPESVRPNESVLAAAVAAVSRDMERLPDWGKQSFKTLLPCSHAARALCLLSGESPSTAWRRNWQSARMIVTDKGYRLKPLKNRNLRTLRP